MKKLIALMLALMMGVTVMSACAKQDANGSNDTVKIGIISMIENTAFTDMKDGIIEGLKDAGYVDGETAKIDYQCAGGDTGTLASIASSMNDGSYDAIFCVATPPTMQVISLESETPCFFCAVSAPVESGVVEDLTNHAANVTGTSNAIPIQDIFALADQLTPGYGKVGIITSGKEPNATNTAAMAKEYLEGDYLKNSGVDSDIQVVEVTAETSADVETAANAIVDADCDIVFIPNDSVVQAGVTKLAEICNENGIGTYGASMAMVASGCLATVAINDVDIGKLTAKMYADYKKGTAIADQPVIVCDADYCTVTINNTAKDALSIEVPAEVTADYID